MFNLSPRFVEMLIKSSSGGDKGLEDYLYELYPSFVPIAYLSSHSKQMYVIYLQDLMVQAAIDKSLGLVDYFETTRNMTSDFTHVAKTIGDGQTDNYRNASARMKDRENAWNRLEREGEEDTKNYHVAVSRSKGTEEGKSYDFSTTRQHSRGCSFDTAINQTKGEGKSKDYSHTVRKSSSLSQTKNAAPLGVAELNFPVKMSDRLPGDSLTFRINSLFNAQVEIPDVTAYFDDGFLSIEKPTCQAKTPDDSGEQEITCEGIVDSQGRSTKYSLNWNWTASAQIATVSSGLGGGGEISESTGRRTDQVCSNSSSSVNGISYGFNNYSQTDSGYNEGRTKNWGVGNTLHQTGSMARGERLNYGRSKGEIKGLIEFCSQTDSASRKRKVATGEVDAVAKAWSRTVTDAAGSSNKITNSKSSIIYWNQQIKNLKTLHKLLMVRLQQQHDFVSMQGGTESEESLFRLCTFTAKADIGACAI